MIRMFTFLVAFLVSGIAFAEGLSNDSIQGSWRILTLSGEVDEDEDYWEFNGNKFVQNLAGHRMSPDEFVIKGEVIDLGYAKIKVLEFDSKLMTANMAGFKYTLEKK